MFRSNKNSLHQLQQNFKDKIKKFIKISKTNNPCVTSTKPKIIFDTDIGSDIDDALALLMLLHLPEDDYELIGVTTAYGFTGIRAAVAKKIIEAHEKDIKKQLNIPVLSGSSCSVKDIEVFPIWHAGTEGIGLFTDSEIDKLIESSPYYVNRSVAEKRDNLQATNFIIEQVLKYPNQITIVSLGAMTNIAKAFMKNSKLPKLIKRIVFMGTGVVPHNKPVPQSFEIGKEYHCHSCHNVRTDASAAAVVFTSGVELYAVGHTVTHAMWFEGDVVDHMTQLSYHKGTNPYKNDNIVVSHNGKDLHTTHVVGTLLDVWLKHRRQKISPKIKGTCPHDALTTSEAIYPGRFLQFVRGHMVINEVDGNTCFIYDPQGGTVNIAIGWKEGGVEQFMKLLTKTMLEQISKKQLNELLQDGYD